ncbi:Major Facilitator Superfamily protein [Candidatus Norongarragalina meridionalis]|nr:Major Facilitator Superfamily protein [Candidatus Norongarragalina meridionalis]
MDEKERKQRVRTFAAASFLNDMGSDMIYPIWPLFVTGVMGADMAVLGLIDGLGDAIVSISQAISGYLSDKWRKRKIFVWLGYAFGGLSRIGYAVATTWQQLIPFRVLDRAGKMRGAPRDAMVADASTHGDRGANFGLLRTMDNLGAVFGILTCIFLLGWLGYRNLFLLAAVPSVIAVALIYFFIKEQKPAAGRIAKPFSLKNIDGNFKLFIGLSALFSLGAFSYSFLLVYAQRAGGFDATFIPVLYLIFTAVASLTSLPFGKFADKLGRKNITALSFALWTATCLSFIYLGGLFGFIMSFVLYGLHRGAIDTVQRTFVSELIAPKYRATGLGVFQMAIGLCALPASVMAGVIWDSVGMTAPFWLSIGLSAAAVILLYFVKEK